MSHRLKSLILTSGTLAPLKPLISELELNVGSRLENPHIITGEQICVKILSQGPDSETLNCNFQNRYHFFYTAVSNNSNGIFNILKFNWSNLIFFFLLTSFRNNPKYMSSLGMAISNLVRVIPGGLLIFYPSYPILQKCQEVWQQSGIWGNINNQKVNIKKLLI